MKIWSWNVNGLRAIVKKDFTAIIEENDPDILCLQETKLQEEQIPIELRDFNNYDSHPPENSINGIFRTATLLSCCAS